MLGLLGGALGAGYNEAVRRLNLLRRGLLHGKEPRRVALLKLVEAITLSLVCFTIYYALPFGFGCRPCPSGSECNPDSASSSISSSISSSSSGSADANAGGDGAPGGLNHLEYVRFNCAAHEHNELATLIQSGQEGMLKHLYMRSAGDGASEPTLACCTTFLLTYFLLAVTMFGVGLPAGNFVPGMTIGGLLGRLVGQLAFNYDLILGRQRGTFALIGTAAVLGGMTRMTLTLSVILAELTNDVALLPALMFTLALSRAVGDALNHSFDDMMIHIQGLPYLEEEVPKELEVLAARDVMSAPVVKLPEKVRVSQLLATLRQSAHNGFPIVGSKPETMHHVSGLILRQQLELILELRLWGNRSGKEIPLAEEVRLRFISSITMADTPMRNDGPERRGSLLSEFIQPLRRGSTLLSSSLSSSSRRRASSCAASGVVSGAVGGSSAAGKHATIPCGVSNGCYGIPKELSEAGFSAEELNAFVDLRVFMDPAPHTISELAPMASVYNMFNLMGVRHLPVRLSTCIEPGVRAGAFRC